MYEFVDIEPQETTGNHIILNSESLELPSGYIEYSIDGYQTLNITGRELIGRNVITSNNESTDGTIYQNSTLKHREIVVEYYLEADTSQELLKKYEKLNRLLNRGEPFDFSFYDEPDYYYTGILGEVGTVEQGRTNITSTFTLYCSSPYKHSRPLETTAMHEIFVDGNFEDDDKLTINTLTIEPNNTPSDVVIYSSTGQIKYRIRFNNSLIQSGDVLFFDFLKSRVYINNTLNLNAITWQSDFENIELKKGDFVVSFDSFLKLDFSVKII